MAMTVQVEIVSAEGAMHSGQAAMVYAPGQMGELGIAPRHAPLITWLKPGDVRVEDAQGQVRQFYVSGGLLEVQPDVVTILADRAILAQNIDEAAALEAKRHAEDALSGQMAQFEYAKAQSELAEAIAQLRTVEKLRKMKTN